MPITDALRAELAQYLIGEKLRALRLRRSMGLTQLGQRTGLSPALLSKIENGKLVPTIPTLLRMATVFEVTLDHFFQNEHRRRIISVTRKQDREKAERRLVSGENHDLERLDLGAGERKFHPYLAEFFPVKPGSEQPHIHQGCEFLHILSGRLELSLGSDTTVLEPGDSIYFDSNLRHGYRSMDEKPCRALMVLAYPERSLSERRMEHLAALHGRRRAPLALGRVNGTTLKPAGTAEQGKDAPTGNGGQSST